MPATIGRQRSLHITFFDKQIMPWGGLMLFSVLFSEQMNEESARACSRIVSFPAIRVFCVFRGLFFSAYKFYFDCVC